LQVGEWQDGQEHARRRFQVRDKPVAFALDGLNETRTVGVVAQRAANLSDDRIDAAADFDEDVTTPEAVDDFVPSDDLVVTSHEQHQQLHRPALDVDPASVPKQLVRRHVEGKPTKSKHTGRQVI
jgi:hypothetical protein